MLASSHNRVFRAIPGRGKGRKRGGEEEEEKGHKKEMQGRRRAAQILPDNLDVLRVSISHDKAPHAGTILSRTLALSCPELFRSEL